MALYGPRGKYWAMTERRKSAIARSESTLAIGSSAVSWDGNALSITIDELAIPRFVRLKGNVRLYPHGVTSRTMTLDSAGHHQWWPIAPAARVEVEMEQPALRWSGSGYFDTNTGARPLEQDFVNWTWSRSAMSDCTAVLYDNTRRDGSALSLAYRFDRTGQAETFTPPPTTSLRSTGWRIARETRSEDIKQTGIIETLEDTPFYARSLLSSQLLGQQVVSVHESLSLDRFRSRWVQTLLPFRMPRVRH